jgi:phosphoribosylformylglycinamidine (FGAM) synthase PurS component
LNLYVSNKKFYLKELQCNSNMLDHGGFIIFYKNLSKTAIEVVSMNKCSIPFETSFLIPNFIDSADKLRVLSLEGNNLRDNVGALILQHVTKSKNIKYLNLSNNPLADQSISELCNLLVANRVIECIEYENTM